MSEDTRRCGYGIFRNMRNGDPERVATVATLFEAEQTLNALAWVEPGDYFTQDCSTGEIVSGRNRSPQSRAGSNREAALMAA